MNKYFVTIASCLALLHSLTGCGGHGSNTQADSKSRLSFAIEWPTSSRFIHQSADRLQVSATVNGVPIDLPEATPDADSDPKTVTLAKPASEMTLPKLPSGPVTFTVVSYRAADPPPTELAVLGKAMVPVILVPGNNPNLEFVLESQTATVEVSLEPAEGIRRVGQVLTVNARSKQGTATVIEGSGEFTYTLSDPTKLRLVGDSQVEVLAEGTSSITAKERGNDSTGKSGTVTVRTDEYDQSEWSLFSTNLPVSQSGQPLFSPSPVYVGGLAYFAYGRTLLSVNSAGNWSQHSIAGIEPDVSRIELIGVGPSEEMYVRGWIGSTTYVYRLSSAFVATEVSNSAGGHSVRANIFSVTRSGRFSSRVPSFDNWDVSLHSGPLENMQSWVFTGQQRKPVFQALDSGGAVVWNYDGGNGILNKSFYVASLTPGTSNSAVEIVRSGYSHIEITTMNQEGYWRGVAKSGSNSRTVIGKNDQVLFLDGEEGAGVFTEFPNPTGATAFAVYNAGVPDHWEIYNPVSNQSAVIDLGNIDLTALGIHAVVNGGVMVASYEGKVAILKRTN